MATGGPMYKKSVREQFERHHEALSHKNRKYPDYDKYEQKKQIKLPRPDVVEFGKAFDVPYSIAAKDNSAVMAAYNMVLSDYFIEKAKTFPTWEGLPTIKVKEPTDALGRIYKISWYVQVPKQFVISPDDKLEEDLWNS